MMNSLTFYEKIYIYLFLLCITESWMEELTKNKDWFVSQNSVYANENKRIKKSTIKLNSLAGVEGSFRKLEVD